MPVRKQWARCFIKRYRNFSARIILGTEASNNNVKSYFLNGMSHLYQFVEVIENIIVNQQKSFEQACANDEVLTAPEYRGPKAEYFGKLSMQISFKGLQYIARKHTKAQQAIPTGSNPRPRSLGSCGETCTTSWELGIPCCHTILKKLESNTLLTKRDVHPHWYI
jgi:hypothetical protein